MRPCAPGQAALWKGDSCLFLISNGLVPGQLVLGKPSFDLQCLMDLSWLITDQFCESGSSPTVTLL